MTKSLVKILYYDDLNARLHSIRPFRRVDV